MRPRVACSTSAMGSAQGGYATTVRSWSSLRRGSAAGDERPGGPAKLGIVERDRSKDLEVRQPGLRRIALFDVGRTQGDHNALVDRGQIGQEVPRIFTLAAPGFDSRIENIAGLLPELRQGEQIFFHPTRLRDDAGVLAAFVDAGG